MKAIHLFTSLCFLLLSCSCCSKKNKSEDLVILQSSSFKNGKKSLLLFKNKSLDTLRANQSLSYQLKESTLSDVIHFEYERDTDKVATDGSYREELLFEIAHGDYEQFLKEGELQKTKMLFGRYCYCRGQAGLFKITKGTLHLIRKKDKTNFELTFKPDSVPQENDTIVY